MKIVHLMDWYQPNMGYLENYLPMAQKKLGHDVEIIAADRYAPFNSYEESLKHVLGDRIVGSGLYVDNEIPIHRLPCRFEIQTHGLMVVKNLKKKLFELNPDIIHSQGSITPHSIQSILYKDKIGYNIFLNEHVDYKNLYPYHYYKKVYFRFFKYLFFPMFLNKIEKIFPITPASEVILLRELGIPKNKIELIPLGVNHIRFVQNNNERKKIRIKLNIKKEDIVAIYAGKILPNKKIEFLISASEKFLKQYENFKLIILGNSSNEYINKLKNLVIKRDLTDNIIFHEFVKNRDLPSFYSASDIGIWPSDPSNTIIEAMSCSLPIILPKNEETNHLVENNGFLFEKENESDFQNYLGKLIQDSKLRRIMGNNSRKLVDKNFSSKVIAEKTIDAYENSLL